MVFGISRKINKFKEVFREKGLNSLFYIVDIYCTRLKDKITYIKEYGLMFFCIKNKYLKDRAYNKYIDMIYDKLMEEFRELIDEYKNISYETNGNINDYKNIWVCWWQGEKAMPELCHLCYLNLLNNTPIDYTVHLITKYNYLNYVNIPQYIITKMEMGKITLTQFSDILRQALLYSNGGIWLDASVWVTNNYMKNIDLSKKFWSVKLKNIDDREIWGQWISDCKWSGFILAAEKGNILNKFVYDGMCLHYKNHECVIDYFIQNFLIRIAYNNLLFAKALINAIDYSNEYIYELEKLMNCIYEENKWNQIIQNTGLFKLTQKGEHFYQIEGKETFYGHIVDSMSQYT